MLEIVNKTAYQAAIAPGLDKEGCEHAVVIVKGTFVFNKTLEDLKLSELQVPIIWGDIFYGEPGVSSVRYESDTSFKKKSTDVVLIGHAYTNRGKAKSVDVTLQVGQIKKTIRVIGNRHWYRSFISWQSTEPEPFDRMPLVYERAFGGRDNSNSNPAKHSYENRNPVGTGFSALAVKVRLEGLALPNLENPDELIKNWKDKPTPTGFGFIARSWMPRVGYAGTYDEKWLQDRCPFLPSDFDEFYFQAAHPDLISDRRIIGGEPVRLINLSKQCGDLTFKIPKRTISVVVSIQGHVTTTKADLDTVVIEPDESRLAMTWRLTIRCPRTFLYIEWVKICEH